MTATPDTLEERTQRLEQLAAELDTARRALEAASEALSELRIQARDDRGIYSSGVYGSGAYER